MTARYIPASRAVEIADSLSSYIATVLPSGTEPTYLDRTYKDNQLVRTPEADALYIDVVPTSSIAQSESRKNTTEELLIEIIVRYRYSEPLEYEWLLDNITRNMQDLADSILGSRIEDYRCVSARIGACNSEHLNDWNQYTTVMAVVFRKKTAA
jgi:hypothetical protein